MIVWCQFLPAGQGQRLLALCIHVPLLDGTYKMGMWGWDLMTML